MKQRAFIRERTASISDGENQGHISRKKQQVIKATTGTPAHFHQRID
jgi:hypothetical protein